MRSRIRSLGVLAAAIAMELSLATCSGRIAIEGRVFARPLSDSLLPSVIVVDAQAPDTAGLTPLPDAVMWLYTDPRDTVSTRPDTILRVDQVFTTRDGAFGMSTSACPCRFTAALGAYKTGYRGLTVAFRHDSGGVHRAVVILSPKPSAIASR